MPPDVTLEYLAKPGSIVLIIVRTWEEGCGPGNSLGSRHADGQMMTLTLGEGGMVLGSEPVLSCSFSWAWNEGDDHQKLGHKDSC